MNHRHGRWCKEMSHLVVGYKNFVEDMLEAALRHSHMLVALAVRREPAEAVPSTVREVPHSPFAP
jgi:hypothetical protein